VITFVQDLLNGLMTGAVYALFAVGLTLSLGALRVMNLAHGATFTLAAIAGVQLCLSVTLPFPLLVLFGGLVGAAVGVVLELVAFRPLRAGMSERNIEMPSLVSSLAVLFILQTVAQQWTKADVINFPSDVFQSTRVDIGPLSTRSILLIMFVTAFVLVAICWWCLMRTQAGRAVRAVAMDDEAAGMVGIDARMVRLVTTSLSSALAGVAGIFIAAAVGAVSFTMGEPQLLKGFSVVILGGIGSVPGALVGGLLLGVLEGFTTNVFGSEWQQATAFVLLIGFLLIRPQGIFGRPVVDRA
jgi:branched-chain amino acid transport system permease protein